MATSPHDTVKVTAETESQEIDMDLLTCLQELEPNLQESFSVSDDLFDQLCGPQDNNMWSTLDLPDVTGDLFHTLPHGYEQVSSLATPPLSPPDSDTPSPVVANSSTYNAACAVPLADSVPIPFVAGTLIDNVAGASSAVFPPSPIEDKTTPTPPIGQMAVRSVQGQVIQVLKSGETVPIDMTSLSGTSSNMHHHVDNSMPQGDSNNNSRKRPRSTSEQTVGTDVKLSKKQQRLMKNRASANISRQKKKEYMESLESSLKEAAMKNSILLKENKALREQILAVQRENEALRTRYVNNDRGHVSKPAIVLMVVFCCGLAIFPFRSYLPFPSSSNSITSLTIPPNPTGRALMSLPQQSHDSMMTSLPLKSNDTKPSVSSDRLLYRQCMRDLSGRKKRSGKCGCKACNCSSRRYGNTTRSLLLHSKMSTSLSDSHMLAVKDDDSSRTQEDHAPSHTQEDHTSSRTQDDRSLIVIADEDIEQQYIESQAKGCFCRSSELARYFRSLKKSMTRDLSNFYLISFKDHLILGAPLHNKTHNPILSVIVPAHNETHQPPPGYMPMLQMDCEVFDTKVYHMQIP